jgi:hypothetical protein
LDAAKASKMPIHFFRFEDCIAKPRETLEELYAFILEIDSVEDTVIQKRINDVLASDDVESK